MCRKYALNTLLTLLLFLFPSHLFAHGGVFLEDDLCVIQIGFFKAHFTIYQPEITANEEFCEDIPNSGSSLFVLEYLHESLNSLPVDFRIIRNVTNQERAATWQDIAKLKNLEQHTVFYQSAITAQNGTLQAEHNFIDNGHYVGIVTTKQPGHQKVYRAVFPFKVGVSSFSYLPMFLGLLLLVELFYLYSNGTLKRWHAKYNHKIRV